MNGKTLGKDLKEVKISNSSAKVNDEVYYFNKNNIDNYNHAINLVERKYQVNRLAEKEK